MSGNGRRACFSRCALLVEHVSRCCCAMHNANPRAESFNTEPAAAPAHVVDSTFGNLLTALAGNNAFNDASPLWRAGFKTVKQVVYASKAALVCAGLSVEVANSLVQGRPCVPPTGYSVDLPVNQALSTAPEPSRPDQPALAFTTRG